MFIIQDLVRTQNAYVYISFRPHDVFFKLKFISHYSLFGLVHASFVVVCDHHITSR